MHYEGTLVRLRPPERAEIPLYHRWMINPELRFYITVRYNSLALEEKWFEQMLEDTRRTPPADLLFVIEERASATPIGMTGLHRIKWVDRSAEFGIVIGETSYWSRGYGTDAARTILEIGFMWYGLHRIYLRVVEDNLRAIRSYERVGFKAEGIEREAALINGEYKNLLTMSILEQEFKARLQDKEEKNGL